jgi:hypothetical protein
MPDVYFLGAGFSKAINKCMPSMKELSVKVMDGCGGTLPPPLMEFGSNIEMWLTYLSQPQPWLKEHFNLENRALFLRMSEVIGQVLNANTIAAVTEACPDWLTHLVRKWHTDKSKVITLNYDTLVERAATATLAKLDMRNLYPVPLTDVRRSFAWGVEQNDTFKLHKLHGSVNWYYSGASSFHGEVLYFNWVSPWGKAMDDNEQESRAAAQDKVPLIVPPTSEKTAYFQHETIRQIWLKASAAYSSLVSLLWIAVDLTPATM